MAVKSLWGDLPAVEDVDTPASLLREQAEALAEATQNLLRGEVKTSSHTELPKQHLSHTLSIIAPALNNYKIEIVTLSHEAVVYPVSVKNLLGNQNAFPERCGDLEQLQAALAGVLQSHVVRKVMASLLAQSKQAEADGAG